MLLVFSEGPDANGMQQYLKIAEEDNCYEMILLMNRSFKRIWQKLMWSKAIPSFRSLKG